MFSCDVADEALDSYSKAFSESVLLVPSLGVQGANWKLFSDTPRKVLSRPSLCQGYDRPTHPATTNTSYKGVLLQYLMKMLSAISVYTQQQLLYDSYPKFNPFRMIASVIHMDETSQPKRLNQERRSSSWKQAVIYDPARQTLGIKAEDKLEGQSILISHMLRLDPCPKTKLQVRDRFHKNQHPVSAQILEPGEDICGGRWSTEKEESRRNS